MAEKNKYWCGILYPENMVEGWQEKIGDILQLPYAYAIHDKDVEKNGDARKTHVHLIIAFPNTTTQNHAKTVCSSLSAEGKKALNTVETVFNIRHAYDYLIHDTETSRKEKKYQYEKSCRVTGNGFDIGAFEQISAKEKNDIAKEMCDLIIREGYTNFVDFYKDISSNYDSVYFDVLQTKSGLFERLTKGNYQKFGRCNKSAGEDDMAEYISFP